MMSMDVNQLFKPVTDRDVTNRRCSAIMSSYKEVGFEPAGFRHFILSLSYEFLHYNRHEMTAHSRDYVVVLKSADIFMRFLRHREYESNCCSDKEWIETVFCHVGYSDGALFNPIDCILEFLCDRILSYMRLVSEYGSFLCSYDLNNEFYSDVRRLPGERPGYNVSRTLSIAKFYRKVIDHSGNRPSMHEYVTKIYQAAEKIRTEGDRNFKYAFR